MNMQSGQYTLHDNAIGQLADKMGIPSRYLRQLASGDEWQRQLAAAESYTRFRGLCSIG